MKIGKLGVTILVAAMILSLAAPVLAAEVICEEDIKADVTKTVSTRTDTYRKKLLSKKWTKVVSGKEIIKSEKEIENLKIGALQVADDASDRELELLFDLRYGWSLTDLNVNGNSYQGSLDSIIISYGDLGKKKTVTLEIDGVAERESKSWEDEGCPYWVLCWFKNVKTTTIEWTDAKFLLELCLNNPNYRQRLHDYYFYDESGSGSGEMVIEPEETAVAPCPFWALMERAEELAGALDEESGWNMFWGAKLAYWDAFHQYLICRDEHFTAEEEAEAAERLEAVKEIIDAY